MTGRHLIGGEWVGTGRTFANAPVEGAPEHFFVGTAEDMDRAVVRAEETFASYAKTTRLERAQFLRRIADEIDARGDRITDIGTRETGLPEARLIGERRRTVGQLCLFADHIEDGAYLDRRHDVALPDRNPLPRPDLRMLQRPIGPVAIFGASNFPLAFSTAGGDTASALAAGCPVVVKGHEAHPGTGLVVAEAILAAIEACDLDKGVFALVQGGDRSVGQALVQHPLIRAVGFTGGRAGGRALYDLCTARPEPIPFFGEMGSINPVFLLPGAVSARGEEIAKGWAGSLTMGAGQFCTNPGVVVLIAGSDADLFIQNAAAELGSSGEQCMLTEGMAKAYRDGRDRLAQAGGVRNLVSCQCTGQSGAPSLFVTAAAEWLADASLGDEVFGPLGLIVIAKDEEEMLAIGNAMEGQLTATLHLENADMALGQSLMPILERKAGRILANGFPTGVEVSDAMIHGGPYPASTNFGHTSVGTLSIRRFLRPVCYQALPDELLPDDIKGK